MGFETTAMPGAGLGRASLGILAGLCLLCLASGCATVHSSPYPYGGRDVTACFYDYTEVYGKRIYPVLRDAPGVGDLWMERRFCANAPACLCYGLYYSGSMESLEGWIERELPTSKAVPFRTSLREGDMLEVVFDGGFN